MAEVAALALVASLVAGLWPARWSRQATLGGGTARMNEGPTAGSVAGAEPASGQRPLESKPRSSIMRQTSAAGCPECREIPVHKDRIGRIECQRL